MGLGHGYSLKLLHDSNAFLALISYDCGLSPNLSFASTINSSIFNVAFMAM